MMTHSDPDELTLLLRETVAELVRRDGPDLTARQMATFLTVYLTEGPHTVRGLAAELNVSKPAITRALDRLEELEMARRKTDPMDRRSVLVQHTRAGSGFLRHIGHIMTQAERDYAAARPSERTAATASKPKARAISQARSN